MSVLSRIQRGRVAKPPRLFLYGTEGIGKSTFAACSPAPIFVQTESGLDQIDCHRFPLAGKYEEVVSALGELQREKHDFQTVVIDSADWLERLIWDRLCQQYGVTSIEKVDGGYARGYLHALGFWRDLIGQLDSLRNDRGMAVILIAHSKIERFEDPEASPYDRYSPRLHKHAAALICEWCDAVLFATRKIRTQSEATGFNRKRTTAVGLGADGGDRVLRCVGGPTCIAKNRYGVGPELPLDWTTFVSAISGKGVNSNG